MARISYPLFFALTASVGLLAVALPSSVQAQTTNLNSEGGMLFDIQSSYDGSLSDGAGDAYDGCYGLTIDGTSYNASGAMGSFTTSLAGRQVDMPVAAMGAGGTLGVQRFIYVPETGGDYARFLDVVTNNGAASVTIRMAMTCNLGSDGSETIFSTGSGDTLCTTDDAYCNSDDVDPGGDPALGHVFQGTTPPTRVGAVALGSGVMDWSFNVTIPPGGRAAMLSFAIQKRAHMPVTDEATLLSEPNDAALVGLDAYLDEIFNFSIATAGAPRVRFEAPFTADEGAEITINAVVEDLEHDPTTWTWDLNGDGTFGDTPGATSYVVPAGTTDGPTSTVRVGIEASDGTNVVQRYRSIGINNLQPVITSALPSAVTGVGANYVYQVVATDPAGAADPLTYAMVAGPTDMAIGPTGLLQWTPDASDVTRADAPIRVEIAVNDGDEGIATQRWELQVSPNRTPSMPTPVYPVGDVGILDTMPRLVANNASDPDFDPLTYSFDIDTVMTFDSPALQHIDHVTQTPGYSFWYVTTPLAPGRWYWRVSANDGTSQSEPQTATFFRVPEATDPIDMGAPDGGPSTTDGGTVTPPAPKSTGGCSVGLNGGARSTGGWALSLMGLAALLMGARRRRR